MKTKTLIMIGILIFVLYLAYNRQENFEYCLDNDNIYFIKKRDDQCDIYEKTLNNKVSQENLSYCIDNDYNIFSREQCGVDEMEVFMQ
jgi:hypothetical protein